MLRRVVERGNGIMLNEALCFGGAIAVDGANVSWAGRASSLSNIATTMSGGSMSVMFGANMAWSGDTLFVSNQASNSGGSVYIHGANVSWSGVS